MKKNNNIQKNKGLSFGPANTNISFLTLTPHDGRWRWIFNQLSVTRGWSPKFATRLNIRFTTTSGHFFANYMSIFHKTEVQTVILRCWTSLYLNWFKSYERIAKKRKNAKNAKNEEIITQITIFLQNQ